jgi:hypothetical protein
MSVLVVGNPKDSDSLFFAEKIAMALRDCGVQAEAYEAGGDLSRVEGVVALTEMSELQAADRALVDRLPVLARVFLSKHAGQWLHHESQIGGRTPITMMVPRPFLAEQPPRPLSTTPAGRGLLRHLLAVV